MRGRGQSRHESGGHASPEPAKFTSVGGRLAAVCVNFPDAEPLLCGICVVAPPPFFGWAVVMRCEVDHELPHSLDHLLS